MLALRRRSRGPFPTRSVLLLGALVGGLVAAAGPAQAADPVARDLKNDPAEFTAYGAAKGDRLGLSLTMGDLNGDGIDDIAAGAPLAEKPGDTLFNRGALHVYFGEPGLSGVRDAAQPGSPDLVIYGENGGEKDNNKADVLGKGVAIGDVNGDGKDDLVVSALRADVGTEKRDRMLGKVYVFFQPQNGAWPSVIDLSSPTPAKPPDVTIIGDQPNGDFGIHLAVTDFDGDGKLDVVIGAAATLRTHPDNRGQVWVVYGGTALPPTIDLRDPPPPGVRTLSVVGEEAKDKLGHAVSVGDLNGDGASDIAAGAPRGGGECNTTAGDGGRTFVIYGTKPGEEARTGAVSLDGGLPQWISKIHSAEAEDQLGRRIHVGDVSGDGQADLIMGARCGDGPGGGRPDAGTAHVLYGPISPGTTRDVTTNPVHLRVHGAKPGDLLSTGTGSGDLTEDGKGDLVLGADGDPGPAGRTGAGSAFVFFGGIPAGVWDLAMKVADVAIHAPDANDRLGRFIATGDVNGDGRADLGVTAYFANGFNNATGNETGEVHVLTALGGDPAPPPPPPPPPTGTHTLTVEKDGNGLVRSKPGGIDCGSDCEEPYTEGTEVKLVAKADDGHSFLGWGGDCSGQGGTRCILTMDADKAVVATFSGGGEPPPPPSDTFTLEVKKDGTGSGVVRSKPDGIVCGQTCEATFASGTEVQLTARADDGSSFGGWSGDCAGGGIRCTLVMDGDKTVTATFTSP